MLDELRKVIPSFLARVDRPDRGGAWTRLPRTTTRDAHRRPRRPASSAATSPSPRPTSRSSTATPTARTRCSPRSATRTRTSPRTQLLDTGAPARAPTTASRCCTRTSASARNRRHKPGRAFERTGYRFDVLGDYGAFRDLQRHRMLTIEWQTAHAAPRLRGARAGRRSRARDAVRRRDGTLGRALRRAASTASPSRPRTRCRSRTGMRYVDADERARGDAPVRAAQSSPQGHPRYRRIAQEMHRLIAEQAGHRAIAAAMSYVDHATYELERLSAERAAEARARRARLNEIRRRGDEKIFARPLTCTDARPCRSEARTVRAVRLTARGDLRLTTRRPQRPRRHVPPDRCARPSGGRAKEGLRAAVQETK